MKKLVIGNEAVARGLWEAGCTVISSYPGTPSTEITEFAAKMEDIYCEWAPNEKVAMEVAFGASLNGARSACAMKHVGMNVAADPLFTMSYTGVNGGLVICVADDPAMHSSQNEQDSRHYAIAAKVPMLEPADSAEALLFAREAFELSERFDTPVMLRMCTRIAHSQSLVEFGERADTAKKPYVKNPQKYIMMPAYAKKKHPEVEARTAAIAEFAAESALNRVERGTDDEIGIITSGTSYQYVREVFGDSASITRVPFNGGLAQFERTLDTALQREWTRPRNIDALLEYARRIRDKEALVVIATEEHALEERHLSAIRTIARTHPMVLIDVATINPFDVSHARVVLDGAGKRRVPAFLRRGNTAGQVRTHREYLAASIRHELNRCGSTVIRSDSSERMFHEFVRMVSTALAQSTRNQLRAPSVLSLGDKA